MSLKKIINETLKKQITPITVTGSNGSTGCNMNHFFKEDNFSLLLNSIPSIISYVDENHCLQYVNEAFKKTFNTEPDSVVGKPIVDFLGYEVYALIKEYMEIALTGKKVHYELELPFTTGKRWIEATYTPDIDKKGHVKGYIGLINDITQKKHTEIALKRKQHELQDYFDNATIALHWVDENGIILWANAAELKMLGYTEEEYIGHSINEFHHNKTKIDDILTRLSANETLEHYESELICKDGSILTVLINSNVLWEDDKFVHTRCFTTNIHERKLMEEALQESEERYKELIQNTPAALYTCDEQGRITLYNKLAADLWGKEPEIGVDMWCGSWKIYQPDGITPLPLSECPMAITLKDGKPVKGKEIVVERPDGKKLNVLPSPFPLFDKKGNLKGAVNMLLDITERKQNENKLSYLAAIVHSSTDPVISKTLEGVITSWNEAAEKLFGYKEKEMIGQAVTKLIPPDRQKEEVDILEKLKKGETIESFETRRITKDGRTIDILLTISPVKDNKGNIIGASKIAKDITTQKILHENLRESEERLRMASDANNLGTWEYNPLTEKLIWSVECKKIYGVSADFEPTNEFVSKQMHPDDVSYVHDEVTKAMNPGTSGAFHLQYRIYRKDNKQMRWLKASGKVYFNQMNQPERFIGIMLDITDDKLTEQKILESEERFRMAVQSTKLGTWEYLPHTGSLTWSDQCKKIYDVPDDLEVNFDFFSKHIHPEDADFVQQAILKAMDPVGDGSYDIQYRILRYSDHQPAWIRAQGKVYFDVYQQPERFIGTVLDITEEKLKEQDLKESVELFTSMADNIPIMIWMSGSDKFADFFNKTWLTFTGRTIEQEKHEGWLEIVHPEDVQKCVEMYKQSFREKKAFYTEYRLKRYDGKYRWIADDSVPRYDENGQFAGFISACMDIDDQKSYREQILESELMLKTISNASPVGLWMTDTMAQCTFVNDTWIQWTGIPFEKQLGTGWLDRVLEEDKLVAPAKFWECLLKREKYTAEFRIIRSDGEMRWCLTEGSPYYDSNGDFNGYAGSVTDITDMKKIEERKDDFIKMASHELKTPLTSITGYVQLLLNIHNEINSERFQQLQPTVKSSLGTIAKQVSKLTRLVTELLDLTRIETGKLELYKTSFNLGELLEEALQDVSHTSTRHSFILKNEYKGNLFADKDRISQVLVNLLTNAIKYSPHADKVEIFADGNDKEVNIKVKDYGIGIEEKDQQNIFHRFYRVEGKSELTFPGFGIGLFIVHEIVERHNGKIFVESRKNEGSVFSIILPIE
jgi:PAS domain S-box-containing protein